MAVAPLLYIVVISKCRANLQIEDCLKYEGVIKESKIKPSQKIVADKFNIP